MSRYHLSSRWVLTLVALASAALFASAWSRAEAGDGDARTLRPAASFASIEDDGARALAIFEEAGKVLTHPRCINCHPAGDEPLQGEASALHQPPVRRGKSGLGVTGMRCTACHLDRNFDPARVPGAPQWHLAPRRMAWEGLTLGQICEQIKDPARNGRRDLKALVEHMSHDALVGWAWNPGEGREPVPGDQKAFGELIAAWVKAGAACPAG